MHRIDTIRRTQVRRAEPPMSAKALEGATVVVVGASSGIGCATALTFAAHGAHVVVAARDAQALDDVVAQCETLSACGAQAVPSDVTDPDALPALAERAAQRTGRIDVWVNDAGTGAVGAFDETPIAAHEQVIQIDLIGYLRGAHAVLPYFKQQGRGVLINVQSVGSWVPQPYAVAYSAAKFGLRGFSEALRGELSRFPHIHVCDIFPSFVDTPGIEHGANYSGGGIRGMPPMLDARKVAERIVRVAQRPRNASTVGLPATLLRIAHQLVPGYSRWSARAVEFAMRRARPAAHTDGALYEPPAESRSIDGKKRGNSTTVPVTPNKRRASSARSTRSSDSLP